RTCSRSPISIRSRSRRRTASRRMARKWPPARKSRKRGSARGGTRAGSTGQNEIPRVAGQHYAYIKKQLADFKARRRTNDAGNMTSVASTLSDADIENLAQYIANLNCRD